MSEKLVHIGYYCWRCRQLVEQACRSDSVPVSVPEGWSGEMLDEIGRLQDEPGSDQPQGPVDAPSWVIRDLQGRHTFTAHPVDHKMEREATMRAVQAREDSERAQEWFDAQALQAHPGKTDYTVERYKGDVWASVSFRKLSIEEALESVAKLRRSLPGSKLRIVRWTELSQVVRVDE